MPRDTPERLMRVVLTRELIVHTAVGLVERDGPAALSMRAVGNELGVTAMAMYRHVSGKDALIAEMAAYVMSTLEVPETAPGDWKGGAWALMRSFRAIAQEYPRSLALVLASRTGIPVGLRAIERTLALCAEAGLDGPTSVHVMRSLMAYTLGSQVREAGMARLLHAEDGDPAARVRSLGAARFPHVVSLPDELVDHDTDADFAFGFELFLEGVATMAPSV